MSVSESQIETRPKRILIVEDDHLIRYVLEENLLAQGYRIAGAVPSGEEALRRVETDAPDLVLMDVMLEGAWDGIVTAEMIRKSVDIPIIFLTCDESSETIERAKITSPFGYLVKPIHARELHATIALALHKADAERLLRQSEEQYRELVENVNEVIYTLDEQGVVTYISQAIEPLAGYLPSELLGASLFGIIDPEDFDRGWKGLGFEGLSSMGPIELRMVTRKAGTIWIRTHGRPIRGAEGFRGVRGVFTDITELKRSQEQIEALNLRLDDQVREKTRELVERNRQLRKEIEDRRAVERELRLLHSAVEQSSEGIAILDPCEQVVYANPSFARLHGYSGQDLLGRHISLLSSRDLNDGGDSPPDDGEDGRTLREAWQRRRDGTLLPCLMTRASFRDEATRAEGIIVTVKDITDLKQVEMALRESKANLSAFLDAVSEPAFMIDGHGRLLLTNRTACDWFQRNLEGRSPSRPFELLPGPVSAEARRLFSNAPNAARPAVLETVVEDRIIQHHLYPVLDVAGGVVRLAVLAMDVTERRHLEKHFIQSQKMASLGVLVSGLAHEINNPNNFIAFNLPILRDYLDRLMPIVDRHVEEQPASPWFGLDYPEFRKDLYKLLENVEHGSERISTIVSSLMESTRDSQPLAPVPVDPARIVRESSELLREEMQARVGSFHLRIDPDLPPLMADPEALRTLILQLMLNAIQAAEKEKSWLRIAVKRDPEANGGLIIEVVDNGPGMDETIIHKAFDPFFTTKEPGKGTGLGLYACHNIVELMGGAIEVQSRPHEETTFRIHLPTDSRRVVKPTILEAHEPANPHSR
jgi:PAS domain S-box-containing protein